MNYILKYMYIHQYIVHILKNSIRASICNIYIFMHLYKLWTSIYYYVIYFCAPFRLILLVFASLA